MIRAFGPGRVNLIGEHTDYNGGLALPFAIDRGVTVEAEPLARRRDPRRRGRPRRARRVPGRRARRGPRAGARSCAAWWPSWRAAGVPVAGARLRITGDLPRGSGLSSSAALEAALALALLGVAGADEPDRVELARLCSRVENDWVGAETGLLDQLASLCSQDGPRAADRLRDDRARRPCRWSSATGGSSRSSPAPSTATPRAATTSAGRSAGQPARRSGSRTSRGADPEAAAALPAPLDRRARHVLSENARVDAMVAALARRRPRGGRGRLLDASHASLRDDYAASVPAVEDAVAALERAGAAGARMVGGGFGGSVLALLPPGAGLLPGATEVLPGRPARRLGPA